MGPSWLPPRTLGDGRYLVDEELGRGGVGVVHAVRDTRSEGGSAWIPVRRAAKILYPRFARTRGKERFANEAETLLSLDDPHVMRVFDAGSTPETSWFVMELMEGGTVADHLRNVGAYPLAEVVRLGGEILLGLAAVHAAGAVHRDIKPGNVLLTATGVAKLGDFGLVRVLDSNLTATGSRLGTVFFVAPEQRLDPRSVTPRSDLFSVSATLIAMATGRRPPNLTMLELEPDLLENVPEPLRPIVRRAAAYEAAERYPSAHAMREALLASS